MANYSGGRSLKLSACWDKLQCFIGRAMGLIMCSRGLLPHSEGENVLLSTKAPHQTALVNMNNTKGISQRLEQST